MKYAGRKYLKNGTETIVIVEKLDRPEVDKKIVV
jgi:predicted membrane GTPase involved in stress response